MKGIVRGRIDWKYALGLDLTDPGFDATVLSEFRKRLVEGGTEDLLLDAMLTLFKERGLLKSGERQRTDSTHVLAKVRAVNRLMCVGEAQKPHSSGAHDSQSRLSIYPLWEGTYPHILPLMHIPLAHSWKMPWIKDLHVL